MAQQHSSNNTFVAFPHHPYTSPTTMTMVSTTITTIPEEEEEKEDDGDDDERSFFESLDRIPSSFSIDFAAASSSSGTDDDPRASFASAIAAPSFIHRSISGRRQGDDDEEEEEEGGEEEGQDYSIWMMAEPMSVEERRQRLLKGMGLSKTRRSGLSVTSKTSSDSPSKASSSSDSLLPCPSSSTSSSSNLLRSRSEAGASDRNSKLPNGLRRSASSPAALGLEKGRDVEAGTKPTAWRRGRKGSIDLRKREQWRGMELDDRDTVALYTIKNLDTGKEFVINLENGTWNSKLSDLQTGDQLTMDEFEKSLGHSPIVRELMRRECIGPCNGNANGNHGRPSRSSGSSRKSGGKKKGVNWLKNIKVVANSVTGLMSEKEGGLMLDRSSGRSQSSANSPSDWTKVHRRGKPFKELTGLYMSQEINAHQGSIWCMRFSPDALFMASAGEDREIHVWEVLERDSVSSSQRPLVDGASATDQAPVAEGSPGRQGGGEETGDSRKLRRGKTSSSRRKANIPDHVAVPETMFSLSEKPFCSFQGHLDDVLDLSWSKSQYLLSSSMDKTVRLWGMETRTCLKLFAHNDYVTCIQFNPVDDQYFISGSLDAKVRIWSIPDRQVVDWKDLHEMVTAACYTPDGQGALVGSHKGNCHLYSMSGSKLRLKTQLDLHNMKKKSQAKKITGFQFSPGNPSEVMITSADSQIRVVGGLDLIHKFRGFRNTSSQMSASYTPDGHYVVCASEDSHVYIWKREESRHAGAAMSKGKTWVTTRSHENFHCKDVSVAVPWPGSSRHEPPSFPSSRYTHANHQQQQLQSPPSNGHTPSPSIVTCPEDHFSSCRSQCPPLPKKSSPDRAATVTDDELSNPSRTGSGISSTSSGSSSSWLWSGPLSSISGFSLPGSSLSARWYSGGSSRSSTTAPSVTAWGLVVVTAGLGGEIKVFQNFGLPVRLNR